MGEKYFSLHCYRCGRDIEIVDQDPSTDGEISISMEDKRAGDGIVIACPCGNKAVIYDLT